MASAFHGCAGKKTITVWLFSDLNKEKSWFFFHPRKALSTVQPLWWGLGRESNKCIRLHCCAFIGWKLPPQSQPREILRMFLCYVLIKSSWQSVTRLLKRFCGVSFSNDLHLPSMGPYDSDDKLQEKRVWKINRYLMMWFTAANHCLFLCCCFRLHNESCSTDVVLWCPTFRLSGRDILCTSVFLRTVCNTVQCVLHGTSVTVTSVYWFVLLHPVIVIDLVYVVIDSWLSHWGSVVTTLMRGRSTRVFIESFVVLLARLGSNFAPSVEKTQIRTIPWRKCLFQKCIISLTYSLYRTVSTKIPSTTLKSKRPMMIPAASAPGKTQNMNLHQADMDPRIWPEAQSWANVKWLEKATWLENGREAKIVLVCGPGSKAHQARKTWSFILQTCKASGNALVVKQHHVGWTDVVGLVLASVDVWLRQFWVDPACLLAWASAKCRSTRNTVSQKKISENAWFCVAFQKLHQIKW